jgi:hypothetical protein
MKTTLATSTVTLIIGILIGWVAKPDPKLEEQAKAPAKSSPTPPPESGSSTGSGTPDPGPAKSGHTHEGTGQIVFGELEAGTHDLDGESIGEDPMEEMFFGRQKKSHENLLADLARKLNLNEEQKGQLAKVLDDRLEEFRSKMKEAEEAKGENPMAQLDQMKVMGALIRGEGLRESMAEFLSDEQLAAYDAHKEKEWGRQVESRAYKDLAKINSVLELSDAQKDQVYEVLYEDAGAKMEANRDVQAFMGMLSGQIGVEIDVGDDGMGDMMEFGMMAEGGGEDFNPQEMMRQMQERRAARNAEKLARMEPILDDQQLERYREHLQAPSGLFQQMLLGVESESTIEGLKEESVPAEEP